MEQFLGVIYQTVYVDVPLFCLFLWPLAMLHTISVTLCYHGREGSPASQVGVNLIAVTEVNSLHVAMKLYSPL